MGITSTVRMSDAWTDRPGRPKPAPRSGSTAEGYPTISLICCTGVIVV